jgi:predicted TIM-barrel fold metal-dependent hydrolase
VSAVGEDNILFETDYPHPTCLYPDPLSSALDNMRELTPEAQAKILGGNATKLYRL